MATVYRRPQSILLSPTSPRWSMDPPESLSSSSHSHSSHSSDALSSSSHTSLSSSSTPTNNPKSPRPMDLSPLSARRIRFAPLPDPRRAVLITDDGCELPLPEAEDATQFPSTPTMPTTPTPADPASAEVQAQDNESIGSSSSSSRASQHNSYSTDPSSVPSTPGTATPVDCDTSVPASPTSFIAPPLPSSSSTQTITKSSSSWPKPRSLSLLRPFKKNSSSSSSSASSHTLTPTPSLEQPPKSTKGITKEEILTLGTINLFRTGSRDSRNSNESDPGTSSSSSGWGLSRWTSGSSSNATGGSRHPSGSPLARTQSTQSYTSKVRASPGSGIFYTPAPARSKQSVPKPAGNRRTGTRMLNGRVYGGPKRNPFDNVPDADPEFVEWGYGGMGSVKGAKSAGVSGAGWEKLHGGGRGGAVADTEDDDGGGMAWARKRKEKREREERERKEKEEREKAEKEQPAEEEEEILVESPVEQEEPPAPTAISPAPAAISPSPSSPGTPVLPLPALAALRSPQRPGTPSSTHTTATSPGEEEHVLRAVTIPARPYRGHSRGSSKDFAASGSALSLPGSTEHAHTPSGELKHLVDVEAAVPEIGESSEEEESDDDEEEGVEEPQEEEEEEEEESEEDDKRRKTALGAGVEKISRHKDLPAAAVSDAGSGAGAGEEHKP